MISRETGGGTVSILGLELSGESLSTTSLGCHGNRLDFFNN